MNKKLVAITVSVAITAVLFIGVLIGAATTPTQKIQWVQPPQAGYTAYYHGYTIYLLNETWRLYPYNPPVYVAVKENTVISNHSYADLLAAIEEATR